MANLWFSENTDLGGRPARRNTGWLNQPGEYLDPNDGKGGGGDPPGDCPSSSLPEVCCNSGWTNEANHPICPAGSPQSMGTATSPIALGNNPCPFMYNMSTNQCGAQIDDFGDGDNNQDGNFDLLSEDTNQQNNDIEEQEVIKDQTITDCYSCPDGSPVLAAQSMTGICPSGTTPNQSMACDDYVAPTEVISCEEISADSQGLQWVALNCFQGGDLPPELAGACNCPDVQALVAQLEAQQQEEEEEEEVIKDQTITDCYSCPSGSPVLAAQSLTGLCPSGTTPNQSMACDNYVETINGCTDSAANNYNPNANSDDGSCTYDPVYNELLPGGVQPGTGTGCDCTYNVRCWDEELDLNGNSFAPSFISGRPSPDSCPTGMVNYDPGMGSFPSEDDGITEAEEIPVKDQQGFAGFGGRTGDRWHRGNHPWY